MTGLGFNSSLERSVSYRPHRTSDLKPVICAYLNLSGNVQLHVVVDDGRACQLIKRAASAFVQETRQS